MCAALSNSFQHGTARTALIQESGALGSNLSTTPVTAKWPWMVHVIALGLDFLLREMEIVIPVSRTGEDSMSQCM